MFCMEESHSNIITYINYVSGYSEEGLKTTFAPESFYASLFPLSPEFYGVD